MVIPMHIDIRISGLSATLTLIFVVLKLCGVIDWGWVWVLAPIWIPLAIVVAIFAVVCGVLWIRDAIRRLKR